MPFQAKIALCKFVPGIFCDAMRENSESSVTMFEGRLLYVYNARRDCRLGTHENPELIWNEDSRHRVETMVKEMRDRRGMIACSPVSWRRSFYAEQKKDPEASWRARHRRNRRQSSRFTAA